MMYQAVPSVRRLRGIAEVLWGVYLLTWDACFGLQTFAVDCCFEAPWQGNVVHFHRDAFSQVPNAEFADVGRMFKAIRARKGLHRVQRKVTDVVANLRGDEASDSRHLAFLRSNRRGGRQVSRNIG